MSRSRNLQADVQFHSLYNTPRIIRNIQSAQSKSSPRQIADSTLRKIAADLKISADLSDLKFDKVKETILGSHVLYQQYYRKKPISGSWIRVDIDKKGRVYNIQSDLVPKSYTSKVPTKGSKKLSKSGKDKVISSSNITHLAIKAARSKKSSTNKVLKKEQVYFPFRGVPRLAWKVIVETTEPRREWKMYIDAASGKVLSKINQLKDLYSIPIQW